MKPPITDALLDELLKNYSQPGDLLGPDGLFTELKKRLINRVLDSELTTHLGYEKHGSSLPQTPSEASPDTPINAPNTRNGHSSKTLRCNDGKLASPRKTSPSMGNFNCRQGVTLIVVAQQGPTLG